MLFFSLVQLHAPKHYAHRSNKLFHAMCVDTVTDHCHCYSALFLHLTCTELVENVNICETNSIGILPEIQIRMILFSALCLCPKSSLCSCPHSILDMMSFSHTVRRRDQGCDSVQQWGRSV